MAIIEKVCRAAGVTPEELIGTEIDDIDDIGELNTASDAAAGEDDESNYSPPGCRFHSCFGCEDGHCKVLTDNDFGGRMCPFFKNKAQAKRDRQDAFDRLLIRGRLDLVNKYEETFIELGLIEPAAEEKIIDDDLAAARAEFARFQEELEKEPEDESGDSFFDDDEEDDEDSDEDTDDLFDEEGGDADAEKDSGVQ